MPVKVEVAFQVEHVAASGGPCLRGSVREWAAANPAGRFLRFHGLEGGRRADDDILDNGVDPELVHGPLLNLGWDVRPEEDSLAAGRQR